MVYPVRHSAFIAAALCLAVATAEADDLADQHTLATIASELQTIEDALGVERRKPLAEQDDATLAALVQKVDGVRQQLVRLRPGSPILQTRKFNMEAELDRVAYLATDISRALQAPELATARRVKAKMLQVLQARDEEAQKPLAEQRRAVFERVRTDIGALLQEINQTPIQNDAEARFLVGMRPQLNISMDRVQADLRALDQYEEPLRQERLKKEWEESQERQKKEWEEAVRKENLRREREAEARQQEAKTQEKARQQEAARREQARQVTIRAKGWSKAVEDAVIQRRVSLGMTPEQVREAWGRPEQVNRTLTRYGEHEQWVYGLGQYLYFESGRLSSIQTSETPRR